MTKHYHYYYSLPSIDILGRRGIDIENDDIDESSGIIPLMTMIQLMMMMKWPQNPLHYSHYSHCWHYWWWPLKYSINVGVFAVTYYPIFSILITQLFSDSIISIGILQCVHLFIPTLTYEIIDDDIDGMMTSDEEYSIIDIY